MTDYSYILQKEIHFQLSKMIISAVSALWFYLCFLIYNLYWTIQIDLILLYIK